MDEASAHVNKLSGNYVLLLLSKRRLFNVFTTRERLICFTPLVKTAPDMTSLYVKTGLFVSDLSYTDGVSS